MMNGLEGENREHNLALKHLKSSKRALLLKHALKVCLECGSRLREEDGLVKKMSIL